MALAGAAALAACGKEPVPEPPRDLAPPPPAPVEPLAIMYGAPPVYGPIDPDAGVPPAPPGEGGGDRATK